MAKRQLVVDDQTGEVSNIPLILMPEIEIVDQVASALADLIDKASALDREIAVKTKMLEAHKGRIKHMYRLSGISLGKYITANGGTMRLTATKAYTPLNSELVFNHLMETQRKYSFKELFSVGVEKLREITDDDTVNMFRDEKDSTLAISFK